MAAEDRNVAIGLILDSEGGYSNLKNDPGGPTQMGITQNTLAAWRKTTVTADDVRNISREEATEIYHVQYADKIMFDRLPPGLDYAVLDFAVNSGPWRAVKVLQQQLGFEGPNDDGIMGEITLAAVLARNDLDALIGNFCDARLEFMHGLATWSSFGKGWTVRVRGVKQDAIDLAHKVTITHGLRLDSDAQAKATGAVKVRSTGSGLAAIGATITTGLAAVSTVAPQISTSLSAYSDLPVVRYVLVALGFASALGVLAVAITRARNGATT